MLEYIEDLGMDIGSSVALFAMIVGIIISVCMNDNTQVEKEVLIHPEDIVQLEDPTSPRRRRKLRRSKRIQKLRSKAIRERLCLRPMK
jgi:hypothetical protein